MTYEQEQHAREECARLSEQQGFLVEIFPADASKCLKSHIGGLSLRHSGYEAHVGVLGVF
jgi:hypothetical protein